MDAFHIAPLLRTAIVAVWDVVCDGSGDHDDERLIIDLLESKQLLLSHGTGFNIDTPDHLRVVFLAPVDVLDDAIGRLRSFLATYRQ